MTVVVARPSATKASGSEQGRAVRPQPTVRAVRARASVPFELDTIATRWQSALDSAQRALSAAGGHFGLAPAELERRRSELVRERQQTAKLLTALARDTHVPEPWLSSVPVTPQMLGLATPVAACLFELEGVLTDASMIHATAWAEALDEFLLARSGRTGWQFRRFDRVGDYRTYLEGRPRLEGVHAFLESRGIRLPEGRPDDASSAETAYGLAKRKGEALAGLLHRRGVSTLPAARRYLEACGYAGLWRAVVSASATSSTMLDAAHLAPLLDASVDAAVIRTEALRSPPAPDVVAATCRRLAVAPAEAVSFTHRPAGVVAARAAGVTVIGVADAADAQLLHEYGADRVVPSLQSLLRPTAGA
jgi:beta-phosphoglucomutase-like phosphatase (HAD superfamily)